MGRAVSAPNEAYTKITKYYISLMEQQFANSYNI